MAVEAVVALMVGKLDKLLSKEARLLGVHGEIKHIRQELYQMRRFLKDADTKQKEDEDVRNWMEDIRDICFDVDDVIDILGQGQAAQGRHGFVERLKGRISDQITRYKVGKEIVRIKLNFKGIKRRRESYRITETRLGESEEVGSQEEINSVSEQLTKEEPSHYDGTRDFDEGILEDLWFHNRAWFLNKAREEELQKEEEEWAKAREKKEEEARAREEEARKRRFVENIIDSAPRLQELSRRSVTPEKIEKAITRVDDQLTNEERTRDIDEGRQEASSSSRNL